MTSHVLSRQYGLFLTGGKADIAGRRLRKTLIVSLVIHLCILALIAGFRLRKTVERPLSAVQVSLVAPPTQRPPKLSRVWKRSAHPRSLCRRLPSPFHPNPFSRPLRRLLKRSRHRLNLCLRLGLLRS